MEPLINFVSHDAFNINDLSPLSIPFFKFVALVEKTKITDKNKKVNFVLWDKIGGEDKSLVVLSNIAFQNYN